jgi:anti-sigma factor RsiW
MNCKEALRLLHAYIDAELDMANNLGVEQHLQECAVCVREYEGYQALRTTIKEGSLYFQSPALLEKRIQSSMRKADPTTRIARLTSWRWLSLAAVLLILLGALGWWGFTQFRSNTSQENSLAQAVLDSHVRSLMNNHLVDLASSDPQTVKLWFDNKLTFSPPVIDLTPQGFSLIGGRLDILDNQRVAAMVYKHDNHVINLFAWPSKPSADLHTFTLQGYYLTHWTKYGTACWAVSDLDENELQQFARLIDQHVEV